LYPKAVIKDSNGCDWYFVSVDLTISRMHSSASNGCECQKGSFSRSPCGVIGLDLQGYAPQYLRQFTPIADIPSRQRLRFSSSRRSTRSYC